MKTIHFRPNTQRESFYKWANALALMTIFYNLIEGIVSVFFGYEDGTVALFGFGIDSFVEVISGFGIWHMIRRMRRNGSENHDVFEKTALKVTGTAFYILTVGLVVTAAISLRDTSRKLLCGGLLLRAFRFSPCGYSFTTS